MHGRARLTVACAFCVFKPGQLGGGGEGGRFQSRRGSRLRSAFQSISAFGSVWFRAQAGEVFTKGSGSTGPGHPLLHCFCPPVPKLQSFSAWATGRVRSPRCLVAVAMFHKTAMGSASELPILLPGTREQHELKATGALLRLNAWRRACVCFRTLGRPPSNTELRQAGPNEVILHPFLSLPGSIHLCEALDSLHAAYEELDAGRSRDRQVKSVFSGISVVFVFEAFWSEGLGTGARKGSHLCLHASGVFLYRHSYGFLGFGELGYPVLRMLRRSQLGATKTV